MTTKEELQAAVKAAKQALTAAEAALFDFEHSPENFKYDTVEDAWELEEVLLEQACEDCEGSYNCGADEYYQDCFIGGKPHTAILFKIEYNRHDKRYYFVDGHKFRIEDEHGAVQTA